VDYISVGKLKKSFGTKGFIRVYCEKVYAADLEKADVWFVEHGNESIPYFVDKIQNEGELMVKFEDIDSPETAKKITGSSLYLRSKDISFDKVDQEEGEGLDKLKGFLSFNMDEEIGEILAIEEYPHQVMAIIADSNSEKDILIPLTPEFIIDIDIDGKRVIFELPEGLLESQL